MIAIIIEIIYDILLIARDLIFIAANWIAEKFEDTHISLLAAIQKYADKC